MKALIPALLVLAGAAAGWVFFRSPEPSFQPESKEQVAFPPAPPALLAAPLPGEVVRVLDVEGMCCRGCTGKLHQALVAVEGVREAAVDLDAGTASALVPAGLDVARLEGALCFGKYRATARR